MRALDAGRVEEAGIAADEIVDPLGPIAEIKRRFIGSPEFANLPRKFKTAISGRGGNDIVHELNDISFVGVTGPDGTPGFDLWVGGGLSTNPMLAQRLWQFLSFAFAFAMFTAGFPLFAERAISRRVPRVRRERSRRARMASE